ncbi:MAG: hypothetical protein V4436_00195 [Patescibacteria group bacterium]
MDELEIEGKKYLSSRKAAREHKYHIDYVGQLIRAGKINGKKVGRSWYVEEASLKGYLLLEAGGKAPQAPKAEQVVEEKLEEKIVEPIIAEVEVPIVSEPEPVYVEPERIIPVIKPAEKIFEAPERVVQIHTPLQKTTLTYIEDTEPLLPVLDGRSRSNADFVAIPLRRGIEEEVEIEEESESISHQTPTVVVNKRGRMAFAFPRIQTMVALAFLTLAVATVASTLLATSIKVMEGQPASVIYIIK